MVLTGPGARPVEVPVGPWPTLIGRARDCTIRVRDASVALRHLEVSSREGRLVARDPDGQSRTSINGRPLEGIQELKAGDVLRLGSSELRIDEARSSSLSGNLPRDERNVDLLLDTIAEIHSIDDMEQLLRRIVDRAIVIAEGARGAIFLASPDGSGKLEVVAARSADGHDLSGREVATRTIPSRALSDGRPVVLTDLSSPERRAEISKSVFEGELGSVLAVPLPSSGALL